MILIFMLLAEATGRGKGDGGYLLGLVKSLKRVCLRFSTPTDRACDDAQPLHSWNKWMHTPARQPDQELVILKIKGCAGHRQNNVPFSPCS